MNATAPSTPRPGKSRPADVPPHHRLRAAMAVMAVVMVLVAGLQAWQMSRAERLRQSDAEVIALAGAQRTLSQRLARLATVATRAGGDDQLGLELQAAQDQALQLEGLLKAQLAQGAQGLRANNAFDAAVERWQAQRERLWYQAQSLLHKVDTTPQVGIDEAIARVQAEADPLLAASEELLTQLQNAAQRRSENAAEMAKTWMAVTLIALLLVTGLVVEPTARELRRQHVRMAAQTVDLERLAMVAERTGNIVIVAGRDRRIVWANAAFERVTGYTVAEAIGRLPREVMHSQRTNPAMAAALVEQLDAGHSVRADMLNRTKDGRDYWVDVDAQPLHDESGGVSGYISVRTVITEQVQQRLQMEALLAALPTGVVLHDSTGRIVECNPAAQRMLHLTRDELLGRRSTDPRWKALRDDMSDYPAREQPAMRTLATGKSLNAESMAVRTPAGDLRWLLVNTEPITGATGEGAVACFVDVTEQRTQQQLLSLTIEGSGVGVWQWDIRSGAMSCNERMTQMLGYTQRQVGMTLDAWVELVHPEDRDKWFGGIQAHLEDGSVPYRCELRVLRADGAWTPVLSTGTVVERSESGKPRRMAGIHIDQTEHVRLQDSLRLSARTDALTQLPNRTVVLERVRNALARWQSHGVPFAVLFMDFDRFKQVNDTLGHSAGDELLRQIAQRLQGALRSGDAVSRTGEHEQTAARIGGDEFVIVLERVRGPDDASAVAARLLDLLSRPYTIEQATVHSSASIGIVTAEHAAADADAVLRDADTAMYEAKRAGRSRAVVFDAAMHERVARQVLVENDLRAGLERKELFVMYQPVVDLTTGRSSGVEALARWLHPVRGLVPPVEFIPVAEESGLIGAVGDFVLAEACAQFVQWQALFDAGATLAVNLSRAQLCLPGLVSGVRETLVRTGLAPHRLQLEVTESLAAQDETVQGTLRELKALGVKLALDDFGTGYSSLACLHLMPVDTVKIDRTFVREAETSEYHRVLIEATIRVAQTLGMAVVAEGIETPGQALLLHALRCDKGQGYLYGKPMTVADLTQLMGGVPALAAA